MDVKATVMLAFVLDFTNTHLADFAGRFQVGAAAGLKIDALDLQQPDFAGTSWRLDRQSSDQVRLCLEFLVTDPSTAYRVIFPDEG
jgi:hypothetical protein